MILESPFYIKLRNHSIEFEKNSLVKEVCTHNWLLCTTVAFKTKKGGLN